MDFSSINVIAELEHNQISYEFTGSADEIKIHCPFHTDINPSCFINIKKKVFSCHTAGCEKSGDIATLLAAKLKTTRAAITLDLAQRYSLEEEGNVIDFMAVERFYKEIYTALPLVQELYNRDISDDDIKKYRLGYDQSSKRITIPIRNREGLFVNIRKYLPGAPGPEKMRNSKGHGKIRLFPVEQTSYETIVLFGGEIKAIAAAKYLNKHNIGAITATAGEGKLDKSIIDDFTDKDVIICMDIDDAGISASKISARKLHRVVKRNRILTLPLDKGKYPKGDINNYLKELSTNNNFDAMAKKLVLLLSDDNLCKEYKSVFTKTELDNSEEPIPVYLAEAISAKIVGQRLKTSGILASLDTAPFIVPCKTIVSCDRSQKVCSLCGIFKNKEEEIYTINTESSAILELIHSRKSSHREALMESLSIPKKCPVAEFHPHEFNNYEDSRIVPQLEITNRASERILQPSIILENTKLELNESYEFTGRNWPHPQTQQSTLVLSEYTQTTDALSSYKLTDEYKEQLKVFQPEEWSSSSIANKLKEIYDDLSINVTHIFERQDLHLTTDLCYHSPLFINFDGRLQKGWAEILIIGDSAQGKSETAVGLRNFYNLGEKVESKNASVAGLLGGLQKTGDRWFVTWGLFPNQDKRLVIMEELKGADVSVISKLTDMRSSGTAEIPKIEKRKTHARTRLLAISNSRSGREISSYTYGIKSVEELIGSIEDVRRFDFAMVCAKEDIETELINKLSSDRPQIEHKFTNDLCRNLILWSWTSECYLEREAELLCLQAANELTVKYHDSIPLIDKGSTRYKIARLAAALAARTFSFADDDKCCVDNKYSILVRKCHVEYIIEFIQKIYDHKNFGYGDFSKTIIEGELLTEQSKTDIKHEFSVIDDPKEFCKKLLYSNGIDNVDVQDYYGCDRETANKLVSLLVRKNAIKRIHGRYYKSSQFIGLLKHFVSNGAFPTPEYIAKRKKKEEKF